MTEIIKITIGIIIGIIGMYIFYVPQIDWQICQPLDFDSHVILKTEWYLEDNKDYWKLERKL